MNRKTFIKAQGATCDNWTWSWSFVNVHERFIIFGAWDTQTDGNISLILSESWQTDDAGNKKAGYKQSTEHIRLIEEEGYKLKTFPIIYSDANKDQNGLGPAKIDGFRPELTEKLLVKVGTDWYAFDGSGTSQLPEEVENPENYIEGASKTVSINIYERNAQARAKCLARHGYVCAVCSFEFEKFYGSIGKEFIHVHHVVPLSEVRQEYSLDPVKDLIPVCPNCHAVLHRVRPALTVEQLKACLAQNRIAPIDQSIFEI